MGLLFVASLVGLVVTGLPLVWLYQPDPAGSGRGDFWWLRGAHEVSAALALGAMAGVLVVLAVGAARRLRVAPGWPLAIGAFVVVLVGQLSGQVLPWDQLGLRAVTVGSDIRGIDDVLFGGDVRFVIVDGTELGVGTYRIWSVVHLVVVPLAAAGLIWLVRRFRAWG
jgi:quinol-cytochrome oxidoreductase complex cytochrome b subunit